MSTTAKMRGNRASVSRTPYPTTSRARTARQEEAASSRWFIIMLAVLFGLGFLIVGAITYGLLLA